MACTYVSMCMCMGGAAVPKRARVCTQVKAHFTMCLTAGPGPARERGRHRHRDSVVYGTYWHAELLRGLPSVGLTQGASATLRS